MLRLNLNMEKIPIGTGFAGVVWHGSCWAIFWPFGTAVALEKNGPK